MGLIDSKIRQALEPQLLKFETELKKTLNDLDQHARAEIEKRLKVFEGGIDQLRIELKEDITKEVLQKIQDEKNN
jgi:hypothetical protein